LSFGLRFGSSQTWLNFIDKTKVNSSPIKNHWFETYGGSFPIENYWFKFWELKIYSNPKTKLGTFRAHQHWLILGLGGMRVQLVTLFNT